MAGKEICERKNTDECLQQLSRFIGVIYLLRFESSRYLLMPEITATLSCQLQLCILPGRKSGCTCHYREVTKEVNRAKESVVPWWRVIPGAGYKWQSVRKFTAEFPSCLRVAECRTQDTSRNVKLEGGRFISSFGRCQEHTAERERERIMQPHPTLSPCCLFIHLFLHDVFPLQGQGFS